MSLPLHPRGRRARLEARVVALAAALWALFGGGGPLEGQSLRGSQASLDRQNEQARAHDFTFLRTAAQVTSFVNSGYLVPVNPAGFELKDVSFPYARPEVRLFVERLAGQYKAACGETLVVTSLTRPLSQQPRNASDRSVHPTGMAVDLRRSNDSRCRTWLESTLLSLEAQGVLEATYERNPPHYHVVVFPQPYARYVQARTGSAPVLASTAPTSSAPAPALSFASHRVQWGETLSQIALDYGTSVSRLRAENGLSSDMVRAGQLLRIPVAGSAGRGTVVAVASAAPAGTPTPTPAETSAAARPPAASGTPDAVVGPSASVSGARTAGAGEPVRHRVRSGESLWEIARAYGVTEEILRAANGISGSRILAGQTLVVPLDAMESGVLRYRVQNGDSLSVIALRLGTTVERIQETNGLRNTRIYVGQVLDVPLVR